MHANKVVALHSDNTIQIKYGVITAIEDNTYQVTEGSDRYVANLSFSCLVEPMSGDIVMFSSDSNQKCHIISIIERTQSESTCLSFPGDVTLKADKGELQVNAKQGITMTSDKNINQVSDEYSLITKKGLFSIDSFSVTGSRLVSKITNIQTYTGTLETVADNLLQKLKNSLRLVEGVDQTQSRDVINTVENLYSLRSKQAAILAKNDIKIDAERIHMG